MGFNTFPCNPYPISTEELNKGNNDDLNARVATLEGDVSDLNSNKANQITIAPFFNAETAYEVGDLVYYNGLTYRCTNDHEGEWDADDFAATTISNELDSLKSGLTNLNSRVVTSGDTTVQSADFRCRSGYACISVNAFVQNVGCVIFDIVVSGGVVTTKDCMTGEALSSSVATATYNNGVLTVTFTASATYTAIYQTPLS